MIAHLAPHTLVWLCKSWCIDGFYGVTNFLHDMLSFLLIDFFFYSKEF